MYLTWIDTHSHVNDYNRDDSKRGDILPDLLKVLDDSGWDLKLIIDGVLQLLRERKEKKDGSNILEANRFVYDLVRRAHGRLYGGCVVDPDFLDESLKAMRICFEEWGFVKVGELLYNTPDRYSENYPMNSDNMEKIIRLATKYDVPLHVHISTSNFWQGPGCGVKQLIELFGAVERVPEAKYILAHFVGTYRYPPVVAEYLDLIEKTYGRWPDNFWMETADFDSPGVKSVLKRVPINRIIAGTDWTTTVGPPFQPYGVPHYIGTGGINILYCHYTPSIDALVDFLRKAGVRYADIPLIAYENAAGLFKIKI